MPDAMQCFNCGITLFVRSFTSLLYTNYMQMIFPQVDIYADIVIYQ